MNTEAAIPQTGNMELRPDVLTAINSREHRTKLAVIMGVGEQVIATYIKKNDQKLTQYAPLVYIKKLMGCLDASEVLQPKI